MEKVWPDYAFTQRFICSFSEWLLSSFYVQNTALSSCCCSVDSHLGIFVTPWTAAHLASLSFTISQSLLKLKSIESVMPPNHLILCHPLLLPSIFPSIRVFPMSWLFASHSQSTGASASASELSVSIQDGFPLD